MRMQELRAIAKSHNISSGRLLKNDLIKKIRMEESNFDCYSSACDGELDQTACFGRDDYFEIALALEEGIEMAS